MEYAWSGRWIPGTPLERIYRWLRSNKRVYHVRAGNWLREHRGIYRLTLFPEADRSDLMLWWLWSRDRSDQPVGVYSHQTALGLHELTDVNPSKLDMTVPPSFRRGVPAPRILRLHYGHVPEAEQETLFRVSVTSALRTILDVWEEGSLPKAILHQAFQQAKANGKIARKQVVDLLKGCSIHIYRARVGGAMTEKGRYATGAALRAALEERLKTPYRQREDNADHTQRKILSKRHADRGLSPKRNPHCSVNMQGNHYVIKEG